MTTLSQVTSLWMWLWIGPALLGLFARSLWMTVLLFVLNAAVVALLVEAPELGSVALAALYSIALVLVVIGRNRARRKVDPNVDRLLAEVQRLNSNRSDYGGTL
jgi:membrane protein implicated in regulation of membrane protease activity